ncbi:25499_t:CDS:2, partial [Dentiscutata erythropus]
MINIPHLQFGQFGDCEIWYDKIFLPALKIINCPNDILQHYPASFKSYRLKSKSKTQIFSSYPLHQTYLSNLTNAINNIIDSTPNLLKYKNFFFHIYSKNLKLFTKFSNNSELQKSLDFIFKNFSMNPNSDWQNSIKLDFGIEFISPDTTSFNSIYWKRNTVINLLYGIGVTFLTNLTNSRINNWAYTYDISEVFTSSIQTLLADLNETDAVYNFEKVQNACTNSFDLFNENINMNYGARLEYRISYSILNNFLTILLNKLPNFLNSNPFYIIPTQDMLKFKTAKLKTLLNTYNHSLNISLPQLTENHKHFRICLVILMKSINQNINAIPFVKQYFGDSNYDNANNVGTLELYQIIEKSNVAWLLPDIFDIDNCIINIPLQDNQQQLSTRITSPTYKNITPEEENQLKNLIDIIKVTNRFDDQMNLL